MHKHVLVPQNNGFHGDTYVCLKINDSVAFKSTGSGATLLDSGLGYTTHQVRVTSAVLSDWSVLYFPWV